jgi:hypothetical protein
VAGGTVAVKLKSVNPSLLPQIKSVFQCRTFTDELYVWWIESKDPAAGNNQEAPVRLKSSEIRKEIPARWVMTKRSA